MSSVEHFKLTAIQAESVPFDREASIDAAIAPFKINIPNAAIEDLKYRLRNARYPEKETVDDTSQGPRLSNFIELMDYWRSEYDLDEVNRSPEAREIYV